jgi:phosphoserine phosphatase
LSTEEYISPSDYSTKTGVISFTFKTGLRISPEMQILISTFEKQGISVFIVSASYKPIVEVFSGIGTYGYNVSPERVIAMELAIADDGKILSEYKSGWVKTQRQGKVDAINIAIKQGLGKKLGPNILCM